jgi:hypothetical protein
VAAIEILRSALPDMDAFLGKIEAARLHVARAGGRIRIPAAMETVVRQWKD